MPTKYTERDEEEGPSVTFRVFRGAVIDNYFYFRISGKKFIRAKSPEYG